jgi:hypothetical protein
MSSEDEPIITRNVPGSTTKYILRSQIARAIFGRINLTVLLSPGIR